MLTLLLACFAMASSPEPATKHLLLIGIDGLRTDALVDAPNIRALMVRGAWSKRVRLGPGDSVSGPGWSALLTGTERHGVVGNGDLFVVGFQAKRLPTFMHALPGPRVAIVDWPGMPRILGDFGDVRFVDPEVAHGTMERRRTVNADAVVAAEAQQELDGDVGVLFAYFLQVDTAGHLFGFSSVEYAQAVQRVDAHVGTLVAAVDRRPTARRERWLVVVVTDHGGRGSGHAQGAGDPLVDQVWCVMAGDGVRAGDLGPMGQHEVAGFVLRWYAR